MLRAILELAGAGVMWMGKRGSRKAAFNALKSKGALGQGVEFGSARAQRMLRAIEKGGDDTLERISNMAIRRSERAAGGRLSASATAGIQNSVLGASRSLQHSRYYGRAMTMFSVAPSLAFGAHMISGIGNLNEKVLNPATIEQMQTQQMFMPRQAYTQRQRAIQAIHQSQMTTRSALGNEAQYMHG